MKPYISKCALLLSCMISFGQFDRAAAQETNFLSIEDLFNLSDQNSKQLITDRKRTQVAVVNTEIEKEKRLPNIEANADLGYLSNAPVWNNHFSYQETITMPHVTNNYSLLAGIEVFHGKTIQNAIEKATLQEELAQLDYEKDRQSIQFLLLSKYLDLATYYNQQKVYQKNIQLAEQRLVDVEKLRKEGMVTRNDIVRNQLQLSEWNLQLKEVNNNINITSKDLCTVLGIKDQLIVVDTNALIKNLPTNINSPLNDNREKVPELMAANQSIKIAQKDIDISKGQKLPVISLYAAEHLNRPFTYTLTPVDIYWSFYQFGFSIKYDVSSLYKAKQHIKKAQINYEVAQEQKDWIEQKTDLVIHAAQVKLAEAQDKYKTELESVALAEDNYNIVSHKYVNQLAVMTDVMDASTALLSAQLNLANAKVGITYQWYHYKMATGNWEQQK